MTKQVLLDEINAFATALRDRGVGAVSDMLRSYILLSAADVAEKASDTESFLNRLNYFLSRETISQESREPLFLFLLDVDAAGKILDLYHDRRSRSKMPIKALDALERSLKRFALVRLERLFESYEQGEPGADEQFLKLFTSSSFEVVKFLLAESQRMFEEDEGKTVLPEILVRMEERMFNDRIGDEEAQAIFDRMSYLFARVPAERLSEVDEAARKIKVARGILFRIRPYQIEKVREHVAFLEQELPKVRAAKTIADYLRRINERKKEINHWDRKLMLHIDLRLALKQYHNTITDDLLRRSREIEVDLAEQLRHAADQDGGAVQAALHHALDNHLPVTDVVERAIRAEEFLRSVRHSDQAAELLKAEAMAEVKAISERFREALQEFDQAIDKIRGIASETQELRAKYKALISEDRDLGTKIDELRTAINSRLKKGVDRLTVPMPKVEQPPVNSSE